MIRCPHCLRVVRLEVTSNHKIRRKMLIIDNIKVGERVQTLYLRLRRRGYKMNKKTLLHDLTELSVCVRIIKGGKFGTTSIIENGPANKRIR